MIKNIIIGLLILIMAGKAFADGGYARPSKASGVTVYEDEVARCYVFNMGLLRYGGISCVHK